MKCPRCGLINPSSASRCGCGYDLYRERQKGLFSNWEVNPPKHLWVKDLPPGLQVLLRWIQYRLPFFLWDSFFECLLDRESRKFSAKNFVGAILLIVGFPISFFVWIASLLVPHPVLLVGITPLLVGAHLIEARRDVTLVKVAGGFTFVLGLGGGVLMYGAYSSYLSGLDGMLFLALYGGWAISGVVVMRKGGFQLWSRRKKKDQMKRGSMLNLK